MSGELLMDTGALVSLLDRSQSVHQVCADFYSAWSGQIITTEAVLTESSLVLSGIRNGASTCIDFVLRAGVIVVPSTSVSLERCRTLMEKFSDHPMDFADATLVVAAEELNIELVFTVDREFSVYRSRGKQLRIVPEF